MPPRLRSVRPKSLVENGPLCPGPPNVNFAMKSVLSASGGRNSLSRRQMPARPTRRSTRLTTVLPRQPTLQAPWPLLHRKTAKAFCLGPSILADDRAPRTIRLAPISAAVLRRPASIERPSRVPGATDYRKPHAQPLCPTDVASQTFRQPVPAGNQQKVVLCPKWPVQNRSELLDPGRTAPRIDSGAKYKNLLLITTGRRRQGVNP